MMQKRIKDSFVLWDWSGVADGLYGAIVEQGYVVNGQINYRECGKFLNVKLEGKLDGYHKGLVSSCEKVGETRSKASGESYASLVNQITQQLASSITGTVRGEVIRPITDSAASMVNNHFGLSKGLSDKIINAIDHVKMKAESATNQMVEEVVTQQKKEVLKTEEVRKKASKSPSKSDKVHVVKKGETVWGIARKLGFNDDTEFMASNPRLKKDQNGFVLIKAGDQLIIPDGAVTQPRAASGTGVYGPNPVSYQDSAQDTISDGGATESSASVSDGAAKQGKVSAGTSSVISKVEQPKAANKKALETTYDQNSENFVNGFLEKLNSIQNDISTSPLEKMSSDAIKHFASHVRPIDCYTDENGFLKPINPRDVYNNDVDAFRHAYASGIITMSFGENIAAAMGDGVESLGELRNKFNFLKSVMSEGYKYTDPVIYRDEKRMDLWNNRVGREIASHSANKHEFIVNLVDALKSGNLITDPLNDNRIKR